MEQDWLLRESEPNLSSFLKTSLLIKYINPCVIIYLGDSLMQS